MSPSTSFISEGEGFANRCRKFDSPGSIGESAGVAGSEDRPTATADADADAHAAFLVAVNISS
eukprot:SAG11_NODE_15793_length_566_cov_0.972163_1_plen_62_part_10